MMAAVMTGEVTSYQVAASCFVLGHTPLVAADWYLRAPELRILYTRAYTTMLEESIAAYKKFTTNNVNRSQLLRDGIYLAHELRTEDSLFRRTNAGTGPTVVHTYDISYHIHEPMDAVSERVGGFHVPSHSSLLTVSTFVFYRHGGPTYLHHLSFSFSVSHPSFSILLFRPILLSAFCAPGWWWCVGPGCALDGQTEPQPQPVVFAWQGGCDPREGSAGSGTSSHNM